MDFEKGNLQYIDITLILVLGLFSNFVIAYDQDNTHPALTDEIVDFYNLSYPNDFISGELKNELIKGAVEEDAGTRPLNHFYDPVYNKGFGGNYSSKEWARNSENQVAYYLRQTTGFAGFIKPPGAENHPADYSYERAIKDYATGNKVRAFQALGHVLHLLEDANVPDHTRDDPHPPIHSAFGSPYESRMAKWSPLNTNIAKPLFDKKIRPVIFNSIEKYFDEVALYSNNNFFSEDTIFIERYKKPEVDLWEYKLIGKKLVKIGFKVNNNDKYVLTRERITLETRNFLQETSWTVDDAGILNDYWVRLSKHLVPHGAGVVKLFLVQARAAEKLYAERKVEESRMTLFQKIIGAVNPFDDEMEKADAQNEQVVSEIASGILDGKITVNIKEEPKPKTNISVFRNVGISQSPVITPAGSPNPTSTLIPTLSPTPSISPSPTPGVSPSPSLTPTPSKTPTPTPTPSPSPKPGMSAASGSVVINEIAWMGTAVSQTGQYAEWIELYNTTGIGIDLSDWAIFEAGGDTKIIGLQGTIAANGYFLIERATPSSPDAVVDVAADVSGSFGGAGLSNSGEHLILKDSAGNIIDSVNASAGWFAGDNSGKSTMERRNSAGVGSDPTNWQTNSGITKNGQDAAGNLINGTPKAQNSWPQQSGGGGGGSSSSSSSSGGSGGGDINTPLFKIVINEIAWAGTGADTSDEWIELYNPTSQSISITGWTLKSFKIASASLTLDTPNIVLATKSLAPFNYFLLERTDDTAISDITADQIYTGALDNTGEILELRDNTGQLQDKVGHLLASSSVSSWYAGENITSTTPPTRKTMERINPQTSGANSANWQTNNGIIRNGLDKDGNLLFGTPKKKNSDDYSNVLGGSVWPMFGLNQNHTGQVSVNGPSTASISWQYDFNSFDPAYNLPFQPVISASGSIYLINTNSGGGGNLSVISNTGQLEWKWPQSGIYTLNRKSTPAVLADKTVYLGAVNSVYAVASKAADKWNICTASPECNGLKAGPITIDSKGNVYFSDENQDFQAVKPDGTLKWKIRLTTAYGTNVFVFTGQTPVIDEDVGKLYLAGTTTSNMPRFFALDLNTGSVSWNPVWSSGSSTSETSHISFDKSANRLYAAANAALLEINPSNGQITEYLLSSLVASASDGISRQPKSLVSIDSVNNALLAGFDYSSVPASGSDKLLASTKTKLFSFNKTTKAVNWSYEIPLNLAGNLITVDNSGNLYFAAEDVGTGAGKLYSLTKDGGLRWILDGGAVAQGTHPVLDKDGGLYQALGFKLYKIGL